MGLGIETAGRNRFPVVESSSEVGWRPWVYLLGTVGAGIFSIGALLLFMMVFMSLAHPLGGHPKPASEGHLKTGQS